MKKLLYPLTAILICLAWLGLGFLTGRASVSTCTQMSSEKIQNFADGKTNFCQLTEMERFVVCPELRAFSKLPDGGITTAYMCNAEAAYIEVSNLSEESKQALASHFKNAEDSFTVTEHCKIKEHTIVYKSVSKDER